MPLDRYADLRGFQTGGGRTADPQPLAKVLSELIALKGLARVHGNDQLQEAWKGVAGDNISRCSMVIGLTRGVLEIGVANTAFLSELASFQRARLLESLQQQHPHLKIRELKFRLKTDLKQ